jgi:hypothetical protein
LGGKQSRVQSLQSTVQLKIAEPVAHREAEAFCSSTRGNDVLSRVARLRRDGLIGNGGRPAIQIGKGAHNRPHFPSRKGGTLMTPPEFAVGLCWKSTLILGAALVFARLLRRQSADIRRPVLLCAVIGAFWGSRLNQGCLDGNRNCLCGSLPLPPLPGSVPDADSFSLPEAVCASRSRSHAVPLTAHCAGR